MVLVIIGLPLTLLECSLVLIVSGNLTFAIALNMTRKISRNKSHIQAIAPPVFTGGFV
jgi:hypothetical protein